MNRRAALKAQTDEQRQMRLQQGQEQEKAAEEQVGIALDTRETASRAQVAAGESGVDIQGMGVIGDIMRQGLEAQTGITQNLGRQDVQRLEDFRGAKSRTQSRINAVSRPSSTATGLKIASGIVSAGSQYASGGFGSTSNPTTGSAVSGNPLTSSTTGGFNTRRA
jgi:hypothetical protein